MQLQRFVQSGLLVFLMASGCQSGSNSNGWPNTRKAPVTDAYHGINVTEDYRWLEDWGSAEVRQWSDDQNAFARNLLDHLESRNALRARIEELRTDRAESYFRLASRNGKLFAMKRQPPKNQPFLIVMDSADDPSKARVLVDPTVIDGSGSTTIDFYEPSWDGKLIAVSMSKGGSESGDVHIFDDAGKEVFEVVPRVQGGTAGGDLAWIVDGSGFFYTRYPHEGERPAEDRSFYQQIYFHKLGMPSDTDRYELGKDLPKIAEIRVESNAIGNYVLAAVQHGDGGGIEHYLRSLAGGWQRIAALPDRINKVLFGPNKDLFLVSRNNAPRGSILRIGLQNPRLDAAQTVIPQGDQVIESDFWDAEPSPVVTNSTLFVPYQTGGPMDLKAFDFQGKPKASPQVLPISAVSEMTPVGDDLLFLNVSYTNPPMWHRFRAKAGTASTSLSTASPFSFDDVEVIQEFAMSRDGTRVPFFVMRPKGSAGKNLPMIVSGYGGYGLSQTPGFSVLNRLILDQGVCYVDTVLRGGGEFGDEWHDNGRLEKKQNVFDDFAAVLEALIDRGETSPEHLAIIGGSNGGLLMGATFTQHPEWLRAVVSSVGLYDMLRVELSPNGAFNIPEFGSVKDPRLFNALYAYSPYHHVKQGAQYPSIMLMTGANDPRVDPMQSRKMTARLQASGSNRPVLLRTSGNTGHGIGTPLDARIEQDADVYSFLFHELGVEVQIPKS